MTTMTTPEQFTLQSQNLGCLPIVNFFLARMGVADHLRTYLPPGDARLRPRLGRWTQTKPGSVESRRTHRASKADRMTILTWTRTHTQRG